MITLSVLQNIILSNATLLHGQPLLSILHKLAVNIPTKFEIVFIQNKIRYRYTLKYGTFSVDYNEESEGIKSLLQFLCPLFDIFENVKVFVCDEIERYLHPSAVRKIIEVFNYNQKTNAQIILITHDIDLLDINILRCDQILFSYISNRTPSSELFRLSDLKGIRKDDNLKKNYLEGNYKKK